MKNWPLTPQETLEKSHVVSKPRSSLASTVKSNKTTALRVAKSAFEGLAPLLVKFGITSLEAEALLRAVCVHETARAFAIAGKKPNVSRVSIKTGVNRHLVAMLLRRPPDLGAKLTARRDVMKRVLDGWIKDPLFSKKGRPIDLEIGDPATRGVTAWSLVQRYAPGVWPRLIIDELIRVDHVESQPNGRLRLLVDKQRARRSRIDTTQATTQNLRDAIKAAFHDAESPMARRAWQTTQSWSIARVDLPLVQKMLDDRFHTMITWVTEELNSARWRKNSPSADKVRVGLSGFMFAESVVHESDPSTVSAYRKRHNRESAGRLTTGRQTRRSKHMG